MKYYIAIIGDRYELIYSNEYAFDQDEVETWVNQLDGTASFASTDYEITKKVYMKALKEMVDIVEQAVTNLPTKESLQD